MKKIFHCFLCVLFITGCSQTPSVHEIRQSFESTEPNIKDGLIKILSFKKINAQEGIKDGIKFYRTEYEAEVEFLKKVWETDPEKYNKAVLELGNARYHLIDPQLLYLYPSSDDPNEDYSRVGGKLRNKGETEKVYGTVMFEKTEKGWLITAFSIISKRLKYFQLINHVPLPPFKIFWVGYL